MERDPTSAEETEYCLRHPNVETGLHCGNCGDPICPRCLVQTPVGARCPNCARVTRAPMYRFAPSHYLLAGLTAVLLGGALGAAWWFVLPFRLGLFFAVLLGAFMGWAMSKALERVLPTKRGLPLQLAAGAGLVLAYLVRNWLEGEALVPSDDLAGLVATGVALALAITQVR